MEVRAPGFQFPVTWDELYERLAAIVPAELHPALYEIAGLLAVRDTALEDFLSFLDEPLVFNYRGAVASAVSDPHPVHRGGYIHRIYVTATAEASTSSTFRLAVDGVQIGSDFTLPASEGATPYEIDLADFENIYVPRGSGVTVEGVTIGTGLEGAVVNVLLRGSG